MRNLFLLATAIGLSLTGCQVTQAALVTDDGRTVARSINDVNAQRTMRARMLRAHGFKLGGIDVEVREGAALLTGRVPRVEDRIEAERIAWSAPGIATLGNEIRIGDKQGIVRNTKDGVLEKSVRTRLIASPNVDAIDLNIETHEGIVYLLGMVDSVEERDAATRIASTTRGTKEVISYLQVQGMTQSAAVTAPAPAIRPVTPPPVRTGTPAPAWELPEETVGTAPVVTQAPVGAAPIDPTEPYYRDPVTGKRITLPPGTKVVPVGEAEVIEVPADAYDSGGAPFYIDPDNGQRVPVIYRDGE